MNNVNIKKWEEIKQTYMGGSLILGNGSSIAISSRFRYQSLYEYAKEKNIIKNSLSQIFDSFKTENFELILHKLWQAKKINEILGIQNLKIDTSYAECRNSLIQVVRAIHPDYLEINNEDLVRISNFISNFSMVFSLNYDLLLYWAINIGNDRLGTNRFKDCFVLSFQNLGGNFFQPDWEYLKRPFSSQEEATLVFYLHGNLSLTRFLDQDFEIELKIKRTDNKNLKKAIINLWNSGEHVPLCVCEANSNLKLKAIHESSYLTNVYYKALSDIDGRLTVYGWGFNDQDDHIIKRLNQINISKKISKIAVSFIRDNGYIERAERKIREINPDIQIDFFCAKSSGCWNN